MHCFFVLIFNDELALGFILISESIHNVASIILVIVGKAYPIQDGLFRNCLRMVRKALPTSYNLSHISYNDETWPIYTLTKEDPKNI